MITKTAVTFQSSIWVSEAIRKYRSDNDELECCLNERILTITGVLGDLSAATEEGYTDERILSNQGTMSISFKVPLWAAAILDLMLLQNKTLSFDVDDRNMLTLSGTLYDFKTYQDDGDVRSIADFFKGVE